MANRTSYQVLTGYQVPPSYVMRSSRWRNLRAALDTAAVNGEPLAVPVLLADHDGDATQVIKQTARVQSISHQTAKAADADPATPGYRVKTEVQRVNGDDYGAYAQFAEDGIELQDGDAVVWITKVSRTS